MLLIWFCCIFRISPTYTQPHMTRNFEDDQRIPRVIHLHSPAGARISHRYRHPLGEAFQLLEDDKRENVVRCHNRGRAAAAFSFKARGGSGSGARRGAPDAHVVREATVEPRDTVLDDRLPGALHRARWYSSGWLYSRLRIVSNGWLHAMPAKPLPGSPGCAAAWCRSASRRRAALFHHRIRRQMRPRHRRAARHRTPVPRHMPRSPRSRRAAAAVDRSTCQTSARPAAASSPARSGCTRARRWRRTHAAAIRLATGAGPVDESWMRSRRAGSSDAEEGLGGLAEHGHLEARLKAESPLVRASVRGCRPSRVWRCRGCQPAAALSPPPSGWLRALRRRRRRADREADRVVLGLGARAGSHVCARAASSARDVCARASPGAPRISRGTSCPCLSIVLIFCGGLPLWAQPSMNS